MIYEFKRTMLSEDTEYKWVMVGRTTDIFDLSEKKIQYAEIKDIFINSLPEENVNFIFDYASAVQVEIDYSLYGYFLYVKFPKKSAVEYILKFNDA